MVPPVEEECGPAHGGAEEAEGALTAHECAAFLWHSGGGPQPLQRSETRDEWTELDAAGSDGFTPGPRSAGGLQIRAEEAPGPAQGGTPSYDSRTPDLRGVMQAMWGGGGSAQQAGGAPPPSPPVHPPTALREAIALHDAHAVEHLLGMLDYVPTAEDEDFARSLHGSCSCHVCERTMDLIVAHREPESPSM